jgi:hypothetical protein
VLWCGTALRELIGRRRNAIPADNNLSLHPVDEWGWGMTLYSVSSLARSVVFEPETIQMMGGAYDELLGDLELVGRSDPFTEIVAKEVIKVARQGVRDAGEIRQRVLTALKAGQ